MAALVLSWLLAQLGVIALIARGYTALAIGFAIVYVLPLFARALLPTFLDVRGKAGAD